jgi:AAA15 family ATPase/GTPase
MLIEFSVSNFRSFREKQTLSMVAAPRLAHKGNVLKADIKGESRFPNLLKVAAIYGPNASGKSNLLKAMDIFRKLAVRVPGTQSKLPVSPFRFDIDLLDKPSCFEISFIAKNQRYQFELASTSERIVEERLTVYPSGRAVVLYERKYDALKGDVYQFDDGLEGGSELHHAWRNLTGEKTLFIAQAVANSSESINQLKIPFLWLRNGLRVADDKLTGLADTAKSLIKDGIGHAEDVADFLRQVDVPVTSIRVSDHESISPSIKVDGIIGSAMKFAGGGESEKTTLTHTTALGEADFDFEEESEGTKGLFGFWLPWSIFSFEKKSLFTFVVDELDSSLHPEIVAALVAKHLTADRTCQLIFSTHDTHLMDTKLLRRDQFWITERDLNGATKLRSIHDFDGREGEDLEKRYYEGRYRGLPVVRRG